MLRNQFRSALLCCFPLATELFSDLASPTARSSRPTPPTRRPAELPLGVSPAELWLEDGETREKVLYEYVKRLPPEVQQFLTQEQAVSYLMATRELAIAGLSPEDIKDVGTAITQVLRRHGRWR